jgi:hypothetical protein
VGAVRKTQIKTMKKIVNLTPHALVVIGEELMEIPASGQVARIVTTSQKVGSVDGIPLQVTVLGDVIDLPTKREDTLLVVSAMVRTSLPNRTDLVSPALLVRDVAGNVIGCRAFDVNGGNEQ